MCIFIYNLIYSKVLGSWKWKHFLACEILKGKRTKNNLSLLSVNGFGDKWALKWYVFLVSLVCVCVNCEVKQSWDFIFFKWSKMPSEWEAQHFQFSFYEIFTITITTATKLLNKNIDITHNATQYRNRYAAFIEKENDKMAFVYISYAWFLK